MTLRYALALLPLSLAACSQGDGAGNGTTTAAAPVAATPAPASKPWTETVSKTAEGYRVGNPDAPIKLVEYGARTCPTCGAFGREAYAPLMANYVATGKVSFEFRDFLVHGAGDLAAALVGQCGGAEPFFPMLEQMYGIQNDYLDRMQKISPAVQASLTNAAPTQVMTTLAEQMGLIDFAKQRGLPEAKVRACLNDKANLEAIAKITEDTMKAGTVTGTPTFILNGNTLTNTVTWADVEKALKAAGA